VTERPDFYLPDFCRARSVLAVILIAALVALLITLARHGISAGFFTELSRRSARRPSGAPRAACCPASTSWQDPRSRSRSRLRSPRS
jgi:hypothetical protein